MAESEPRHREWVSEFAEARPRYELFARVLLDALEAAKTAVAPHAIVETRAKEIDSFAEKVIRRAGRYADPLADMTDLCGGRLIARTTDEVAAICTHIESGFDIDETDKEDVRRRLRDDQFGYLSMHYTVRVRRRSSLGADMDDETFAILEGLSAEIQVRTLLQHAWADICHDRLYKTSHEIPTRLRRSGSRLAAILEAADADFVELARGVDDYGSLAGVALSKEAFEGELQREARVLEVLPGDRAQALKLARLARRGRAWENLIETLEPHSGSDDPEVLRELAWARLRSSSDPDGGEMRRARDDLLRAAQLDREDADTQAMLGEAFEETDPDRASEHFERAFSMVPSSPYHLARHLSSELQKPNVGTELLAPMRPLIEGAIARCRERANLGLELPAAHLVVGRLEAIRGNASASLSAYAAAAYFASTDWRREPFRDEAAERRLLDRLLANCPDQPTLWAARAFLALLEAAREPPPHTRKDAGLATPLVVVAGATSRHWGGRHTGTRDRLAQALAGFEGTVISGGTTSGVCGLVGELGRASDGRIRCVGYLPERLPDDAAPDPRYHELRRTPGADDFSILEPLHYWSDLLSTGLRPELVLGVGGGEVSAAELRMAASLGATVALVRGSGGAADAMLSDPIWAGSDRVLPIPDDPLTLRLLVQGLPVAETGEAAEKIGRAVHERYRSTRLAALTASDPALAEWDRLDDGLKASNRLQAAYIREAVGTEGYEVVPIAEAGTRRVEAFGLEELARLAEREHARFNVERLLEGWKLGSTKSIERRRSPHLVPWAELSDEVRAYDRAAVSAWPAILASAGLALRRMGS